MLYTFGMLTPTTAVIILIIALIIFGPGKLPEIGKSLGRGIKEFKEATSGEPENKKLQEPQRAQIETAKAPESENKNESKTQ